MKTSILAGASVAALLIATSAFAGPTSTILQNGATNTATVQQDVGGTGGGETSVIYQAQVNNASTTNTATVTQLGTGVLSVVQQDGTTNTATTTQTGTNLTSQIFQKGTSDQATITQVGSNSTNPNLAGTVSGAPTYNAAFASAENGTFGLGTSIATIGRTNYLGAGIIQSGASDIGNITQGSDSSSSNNAAHIVQSGARDNSIINQASWGGDNTAFTLQSGNDDVSNVRQGGLETAYVLQTGNGDQSSLSQTGYNNSAWVQQTGTTDISTINQYGQSGGIANVFQSGNTDTSYIETAGGSNTNKAYVQQTVNNASSTIYQGGAGSNTAIVGQGTAAVIFNGFSH